MCTLILIRHGECVSNKQQEIVINDEDDVLTSKGLTQAKLTGKALKPFLEKRNFQLYSSTLTRAKLTAEIIKNQINSLLPVEHDERLIEKISTESYQEVFRRFDNFVENLLLKYSEETLFLIITHGNLIESVIANTLGLSNYSSIEVTNCGVSVLKSKRLLASNMILHLAELL
jgi:broad specificity phosphatase PhoE